MKANWKALYESINKQKMILDKPMSPSAFESKMSKDNEKFIVMYFIPLLPIIKEVISILDINAFIH